MSDDATYLYDPDHCPLTAALNVIGGKWRGLLWWRLSNGLCRTGELARSIPQISRKVLTEELRQFEEHGIVQRMSYEEMPPRVEYQLTEYGRGLGTVIESLCTWGEAHLKAAK